MTRMDDIIDHHMVKPEEIKVALTNVAKTFDQYYVCKADGYTITYNEIREQATYLFNSSVLPMAVAMTPTARDYLVKIKYWTPT